MPATGKGKGKKEKKKHDKLWPDSERNAKIAFTVKVRLDLQHSRNQTVSLLLIPACNPIRKEIAFMWKRCLCSHLPLIPRLAFNMILKPECWSQGHFLGVLHQRKTCKGCKITSGTRPFIRAVVRRGRTFYSTKGRKSRGPIDAVKSKSNPAWNGTVWIQPEKDPGLHSLFWSEILSLYAREH